MYKPKHLKKTSRYHTTNRAPRAALAAVLVLVILGLIITLILCNVPVGEASEVDDSELSPIIQTTPTQITEDISWVTPKVTAEPIILTDKEESSLSPEVVHPELDLSIAVGELYSEDMLNEWAEIAIVGIAPRSEEILELVAECRELLSYECYKGETLVQALAKTVTAEIGGLTDHKAYSTARMEEAAVVWCILNRVDTYYADGKAEHVEKITKAKHQFAYRSWSDIHEGMEELVVDVLIRWKLEKSGLLEDCGRVLPPEYLFFHGDTHHNHFRIKFDDHSVYNYWDWSLPDPYKEG